MESMRVKQKPTIMRLHMGIIQTRVSLLWLLAALPLASGAALVVHILSSISLGLALLVAGIIVAITGGLTWKQLPPAARARVAQRVKIGLVAGLLATLAYDSSRWIMVTLFHYTFWPFDVYPIFGYAIAGSNIPSNVATVIGTLYHYTNGIMFAIAYTILFAPRGWWAGILWALGLEALMLAIYPGWLHPRAFNEFVSVSMLGHVAYGSVLGSFSQQALKWRKKLHDTRNSAREGGREHATTTERSD
jgi:hypothetical protein